MKSTLAFLILILGTGFAMHSCIQGRGSSKVKDLKLVWSDEFSYSGFPDSTKWSYYIGDGCPDLCGWGNNELQYYTRKNLNNARVDNGNLIIEVHKEDIKGKEYSSAKLATKGLSDWKYGRFEIRARIPESKGVWSAIWMLPSDPARYGVWPKSGEIDIMENVGYDPEAIVGSVHTEAHNFSLGTQANNKINIPTNSSEFHIYRLDWNDSELIISVDDEEYFVYKNKQDGYAQWPFDQPMFLILNIAYGGNWGGLQGIEPNNLPQKMEVDYVRVYQKEN